MVFGVVVALAGLVKARLSKTQVDNAIFKLHYRWTTSFCFLCCGLLAASDFIGAPIQCLNADNVVTTYCWVSSTYTINTTGGGIDFYKAYGSTFHGIGTYDPKKHEKTFHAYYQWVPFVLFLQGCLFYLPHQIWKTIEGKQAQNLLQGLNIYSIDDDIDRKKENIIKYMKLSSGLNQKYCFGYVFCEVLNFVNVIAQMLLLDAFFGGMFLKYGSKILSITLEDDKNRYDPMIQTFPRITKCDFFSFGPSGSLENKDYFCVLPQNLLNEKIFLVMWIWFVFLCCVTGVQLLFRVAMFVFPVFRLKLLEQRGRVTSTYELDALVRHLHMGDFFLLYTIGNNVNALCFRDILKGLAEEPITPAPSAPTETYRPAYNSGMNDDMDTVDVKLRRKIFEEDTTV